MGETQPTTYNLPGAPWWFRPLTAQAAQPLTAPRCCIWVSPSAAAWRGRHPLGTENTIAQEHIGRLKTNFNVRYSPSATMLSLTVDKFNDST